MVVVAWLLLAVVPVSLSVWALLDCARRPAWAWSLARRSQVCWMAAIAFGVLLVIFGIGISVWYLVVIRPQIAAVEAGDLAGLEPH